jgi:hypothetical protein
LSLGRSGILNLAADLPGFLFIVLSEDDPGDDRAPDFAGGSFVELDIWADLACLLDLKSVLFVLI